MCHQTYWEEFVNGTPPEGGHGLVVIEVSSPVVGAKKYCLIEPQGGAYLSDSESYKIYGCWYQPENEAPSVPPWVVGEVDETFPEYIDLKKDGWDYQIYILD
jgi:hypothetical protein